MRGLFAPIQPRTSGTLDLDNGHRMYWEETGDPAGIPVLFLHGGPGAGSTPDHRRLFDPSAYRIVTFDQRGSGRSTPVASLAANTTPKLLGDIETLRKHLGVERWLIVGGSWGSTLALAYGEAHPERCLGFVLRGIFLCRPSEIEWFLYGARTLFPEAWRAFAGHLPPTERDDLLAGYYRRLTDPDPAVHLPAASAWTMYEGSCSALIPNADAVRPFAQDPLALALARIEAHYFVHGGFLRQGGLLGELQRIRHLPCVIVQGRYDAVCPIVTADELASHWPEARYTVVPDAGHSAWEPGILTALIEATETFKSCLSEAGAAGQPNLPF